MKPQFMKLVQICGHELAISTKHVLDFIEHGDMTEQQFSESLQAKRVPRVEGHIAIIPVFGVVSQYGGWFSQSMERLKNSVSRCCENPDIGGIILNFDSPGGTAFGTFETADAIREASQSKPIIGLANSLSASASYAMQAACPVTAVTPGGEVGSIGVYRLHVDYTKALEKSGIGLDILRAGKHKIEANPFEPMTEEIRARELAGVEETYRVFLESVAKHKGMTSTQVRDTFGEGLVYKSGKAKALGLVDHVLTLDQVIDKMTKKARKGSKASSEELTAWLNETDSGTDSGNLAIELELQQQELELQGII